MSDGIEIHFNEVNGYLRLGCEPEAFAPYRKIVEDQLQDFPEIAIGKVIEINVIDLQTYIARRDTPRRVFWDWVFGIALFTMLPLAIIGFVTVVKWFI